MNRKRDEDGRGCDGIELIVSLLVVEDLAEQRAIRTIWSSTQSTKWDRTG